MPVDLIRYDLLVQDALRGVIRQVLASASRDGLPGDHHFYISFRTHAQGVRLSQRMRDLYPYEMTIILQHQFWDLSVAEDSFEVGLSFRNVPEMLLIPFEAVTRFFDPSIGFEAKFAADEGEALENPAAKPENSLPQRAPASVLESVPAALPLPDAETAPHHEIASGAAAAAKSPEESAPPHAEPNVVSIDAFRKKN